MAQVRKARSTQMVRYTQITGKLSSGWVHNHCENSLWTENSSCNILTQNIEQLGRSDCVQVYMVHGWDCSGPL